MRRDDVGLHTVCRVTVDKQQNEAAQANVVDLVVGSEYAKNEAR